MEKLKLENLKAAVIVAHPDDETIWMGGTILAHPKIQWTIISLARAYDRDRAPKFRRVLKHYNAPGVISDLEDEGEMKFSETFREVEKRLHRILRDRRFTYLFTHGYNGEYGHAHHRAVHQVVKKLARRNVIKAKYIYAFAYHFLKRRGYAVPDEKCDFIFPLSKRIAKRKRSIVEKLYGFRRDSFEYKSSAKSETFNLVKL